MVVKYFCVSTYWKCNNLCCINASYSIFFPLLRSLLWFIDAIFAYLSNSGILEACTEYNQILKLPLLFTEYSSREREVVQLRNESWPLTYLHCIMVYWLHCWWRHCSLSLYDWFVSVWLLNSVQSRRKLLFVLLILKGKKPEVTFVVTSENTVISMSCHLQHV